MKKIERDTGIQFIPKFVKQTSDLWYGDIVTHENYNAKLNLNTDQGDYNTEFLRLLLTIADGENTPHVPYLDNYINEIIDELDTKTNDIDLATVAKSGSYTDLSDTPTKLSSFENDTNYVNTEELNNNLTNLSRELVMLLQDINNNIATVEGTANTAIDNAATADNKAEEALTLAQSYSPIIANKQDQLTAGSNISIIGDVISATDTTYIAGDNVTIVDNVINATDTKYSAGANIIIDENNVISSIGGGGGSGVSYIAGDNITIEGNVISATDTTYSAGDNITIDDNNVISSSGGIKTINGNQPDETGNVQLTQVIALPLLKEGSTYYVDLTNLKKGCYMIPPMVPITDSTSRPSSISMTLKCRKPNTTDTMLTKSGLTVALTYYPVFITLQVDVPQAIAQIEDEGVSSVYLGRFIYTTYNDYYQRTYCAYNIELKTNYLDAGSGSTQPLSAVTTNNTQQTISGLKKFNTLPQSTAVPANDADLVNKLYVDEAVANASGNSDSATYVQTDTSVPVLQVLDSIENPSKQTKINSNSLIVRDGDNQITMMPDMDYIYLKDTSRTRTVYHYDASNVLQTISENVGSEGGPVYSLYDAATNNFSSLTTTDLTLAGTSVMGTLNEKVTNGNTTYPVKVYVQDTQPAAEEGYTVVWINTAVYEVDYGNGIRKLYL